MKFRVILEYDRKTRSYAVYCPELPGCTSAGDTEQEALDNIREAIALYFEPTQVRLKPEERLVEVEVAI